jgi:ubiquinone/menaquinone biosynthesis C-methylase UbiE
VNRRDDDEGARVRRIYERYSASPRRQRAWSADNPGNRAIRDELFATLREEAAPELASDGEVLDVGCGTGYWLEALAAAGIAPERLTGIDVLRERVDAAAERVPGASVRQADARSLPFADDRFTVVLLFTVLSSLASDADMQRALMEARRVLAPGGVMLCYEPRLPSPLNRGVRRVRNAHFDAAGVQPRTTRRLTVLPPLSRRLGAATPSLYPRLASVRLLRTHQLVAHRR